MKPVGIDLGTTNSVITYPEAINGPHFRCVGDISVILDNMKRCSTPSVVTEDGKGSALVGFKAKGRAGMDPDPIMFVKRYMGTDRTFLLNGEQQTPGQVSSHILRYLLDNAEKRLGQKVKEAVITVPAYFNVIQKQETIAAGKMAGLEQVDIIHEPVAAALMYSASDTRDPLTIMTYDLGGGTFDVAILEKIDGVYDVKSFAGNPFLGGYNFDHQLALWIMKELEEQNGYDLSFDIEGDDKLAFTKFIVLAEHAKQKLSISDSFQLVDESPGIVDRQGEHVVIDIELSKEGFERLIHDDIETTIHYCHKAMDDACITMEEIDEIIMVGGSSRIPYTAWRLEKEFGKKPLLIDPDLCVAVGAAIEAGDSGGSVGQLKLDNIPEVTDMDYIVISGKVIGTEAEQLELSSADGAISEKQQPAATGEFVFDDVPLVPNDDNEFILKLFDKEGHEVQAHDFTVRQSQEGSDIGRMTGTQLAQPISIMTTEGLLEVAPAGTHLPYINSIQVGTSDQSGKVRVRIFEEKNNRGEILINDVPGDLPISSLIEITINISRDFEITGHALIPATGLEGNAVIALPPAVIRSASELKAEFEELNMRAMDALAGVDKGAKFVFGSRLNQSLSEVKGLLDNPSPDCVRIQDRLGEIETLINELLAGWKPAVSYGEYEARCGRIKQLIKKVHAMNPESVNQGYEKKYDAICQMAEEAFEKEDSGAWKDANERLLNLQETLENMLTTSDPSSRPDPSQLVLQLGMELSKLQEESDKQGRLTEFKDELQVCRDAINAIDVKSDGAFDEIVDYYRTKHGPLAEKITGKNEIHVDPNGPGTPQPLKKLGFTSFK